MQPIAQVPNCKRIFQSHFAAIPAAGKEDGHLRASSWRSRGSVNKFHKIRVLMVESCVFSRLARANQKWFRSLRAIFRAPAHAKIFRCKRVLQKVLRARTKSRKTAINPEKASWP
jgi:hypothetical protein